MVPVKIETFCDFFCWLRSNSISHRIHWLIWNDNFWGRRTTGWKASLRTTVGGLRGFQTFLDYKKLRKKIHLSCIFHQILGVPTPEKTSHKYNKLPGIWLSDSLNFPPQKNPKKNRCKHWGFENFGSVRYANIGSKAPESGANDKSNGSSGHSGWLWLVCLAIKKDPLKCIEMLMIYIRIYIYMIIWLSKEVWMRNFRVTKF